MVHHDDELGRLTDGHGRLLDLTAAQLKAVSFHDTDDRMMTLTDLCGLVDSRVPLVLEVKSHFDGDRKLVARMAQVLASYRGPVAAMSFDPDQVIALRDLLPERPRGIIAQRTYNDAEWTTLSQSQRDGMLHLRHALRTQPHFMAYWIEQLPSPAPWLARNLFGCPLLTWTVRTAVQRARAARCADQMIFEGFVPET
jgi:glycerophosphoryl diester phosphodiesterase